MMSDSAHAGRVLHNTTITVTCSKNSFKPDTALVYVGVSADS